MVSLSKIEFFNYPTHLHLLSFGHELDHRAVLQFRSPAIRSEVEKNLQDQELVDQRIVLLGDHENDEDAWELHLITIDRSFVGDTFATSKASELVDSVVAVSG
jgi:hypothetical protein